MNILILGGAGFIGSHLAEKMLCSYHHVIVVDNFDSFYNRKIKEQNIAFALTNSNYKLYDFDILNKSEIDKLFLANKIDLVVHLAAKAGVRPSINDPLGYYNTNVIGTLNVLEAMKIGNCKKMVFASSSSVYGNNKKVPFTETDSVDNPISPYAASKKAGELLCHTYHTLYGFDITCLRFFTVFGPRQRPDLAIHKFAKLIIEDKPIPFYGDGSTERDYTYVDDIVNGIILSIEKLKGFNIYNLGESRTISLNKMVEVLERVIGIKAKKNIMPMQLGDVKRTFADISKANKELGYNPTFDFETGVINFINWLKNENTSYH